MVCRPGQPFSSQRTWNFGGEGPVGPLSHFVSRCASEAGTWSLDEPTCRTRTLQPPGLHMALLVSSVPSSGSGSDPDFGVQVEKGGLE